MGRQRRRTTSAIPDDPLSPEHRRFVGEYLIDENATRAYLAVFPGTTNEQAKKYGSRLVAREDVNKEIQAGRYRHQKKADVSAVATLKESARIAFADPLYLFEDDGKTLKSMRDIPMATRRVITQFEVKAETVDRLVETTQDGTTTTRTTTTTRSQITKVKLVPKDVGLGKLFDHLGLSREVDPIDVLLSTLPPRIAEALRTMLAEERNAQLPPRTTPEAGSGRGDAATVETEPGATDSGSGEPG